MNNNIDQDVQIFDDLIDEHTLFILHNEIQKSPWTFDTTGGNRAKKFPPENHGNGEYRFWGMSILQRVGPEVTYTQTGNYELFQTVQDIFNWFNEQYANNSLRAYKIHINGQTKGQDGGIHIDDGFTNPHTLMIFPYFGWKPKWGGQFQIFDTDKKDAKLLKEIDYVPGRIILFKGHLFHRGLGPLVPNVLRTSLVYKCEKTN